jgi:hypothetical protein
MLQLIYILIVICIYLIYNIWYIIYNRLSPLETYNYLNKRYCSKMIFNIIIKLSSPYSGSINPNIKYFDNTRCICYIIDKRSIHNPFKSIHALALANLGELTSGLDVMEMLKSINKRGIVTKIKSEYYKKACGKITSYCDINHFKDNKIVSLLYNTNNELVCKVVCYWEIKNK